MHGPENFTVFRIRQKEAHTVSAALFAHHNLRSHDRNYSNLGTLTTGEVHYNFRDVHKHGS